MSIHDVEETRRKVEAIIANADHEKHPWLADVDVQKAAEHYADLAINAEPIGFPIEDLKRFVGRA